MPVVLLIFCFGGLGAVLRYFISVAVANYGVETGKFVAKLARNLFHANNEESRTGAMTLWVEAFPWATLFSNVFAATLLGFLAGVLSLKNGFVTFHSLEKFFGLEKNALVYAVMIGFCGSLSTFSTFTRETILLVQRGNIGAAALNIFGNLMLSTLVFFIGLAFAGWVGK